jgi:hypothetical protein
MVPSELLQLQTRALWCRKRPSRGGTREGKGKKRDKKEKQKKNKRKQKKKKINKTKKQKRHKP